MDASSAPDLDGFEVPAPVIDRDVYVMPMFATLPVGDLGRSRAWYAALGFVELAVMPAPDGSVQLVHLRRYRHQDLLLVPDSGESVANTTRISFAHTGPVDELDAVAEAVRAIEGGVVHGPTTTPWRAVELEARDPDGHLVVLTAQSTEPAPEGWDDFVRSTIVE